jgi:hypothetical protein
MKEEVENFWKGIWQKDAVFNEKAEWLDHLEKTYCTNVTTNDYTIDTTSLDKVIQKIQPNKAPGNDSITGYWYKHLTSYRHHLARIYNHKIHSDSPLPTWLSAAHTVLLPKTKDTHIAKNYRPIACLNIMYKLYTSCINHCLMDHAHKNDILAPEQAAGNKGVWGTIEQLLINKSVLEEVKSMRRSLVTVWLDYKKAFDSIPHRWLLHALKLAKIPEHLITAIKNLTESWYTVLNLKGENDNITSDLIKVTTGIYQGDSLSVILFVLALNPLSHLLRPLKGYAYDKKRHHQHTHNFFVDDLKLYATNVVTVMKQLDIVTTFSRDIGMQFGQEKCAYLHIERGSIVESQPIVINQLTIKPVAEGEYYRYLGIDEDISYNGPLNKEKVTKEYLNRVKKI